MNGKGEEIDLHVESVMTYFDDDRPQCHIQPPAGWMNDPNGPILYNGKYHMYVQMFLMVAFVGIETRLSLCDVRTVTMTHVGWLLQHEA